MVVTSTFTTLVGFGLLTALVSWVSQVHPALTRRRGPALRLASLLDATGSVDQVTPLTTSLAVKVTQVRVDFAQRAETCCFRDGKDRSSLATRVGFASDLAARGQSSSSADLRVSAAMLIHALEDFAGHATPIEIFRAYATDHDHNLVRS